MKFIYTLIILSICLICSSVFGGDNQTNRFKIFEENKDNTVLETIVDKNYELTVKFPLKKNEEFESFIKKIKHTYLKYDVNRTDDAIIVKIFTNTEKTCQNTLKLIQFFEYEQKYDKMCNLALSATLLNDMEINYLLKNIKKYEGDISFLSLIALTKSKEKRSVMPIGEGLINNENRYYALSLGIMRYKEGIPYLRKIESKFKDRNINEIAVLEDTYLALRMLGEKRITPDILPPRTENKAITINITSSSENLYLEDNFKLEITCKNISDKDIRISSDVFDFYYLKLSSPTGEIILPAVKGISSDSGKQNIIEKYPLIKNGETLNYNINCSFKENETKGSKWPKVLLPQKIFYLDFPDTFFAYELGFYETGKSFDVDFAIVYNPKHDKERLAMYENQQPEEYKKLGTIPIYLDTIISNTIRIHFHGTKRK